jgi:hypothetical protein
VVGNGKGKEIEGKEVRVRRDMRVNLLLAK